MYIQFDFYIYNHVIIYNFIYHVIGKHIYDYYFFYNIKVNNSKYNNDYIFFYILCNYLYKNTYEILFSYNF